MQQRPFPFASLLFYCGLIFGGLYLILFWVFPKLGLPDFCGSALCTVWTVVVLIFGYATLLQNNLRKGGK